MGGVLPLVILVLRNRAKGLRNPAAAVAHRRAPPCKRLIPPVTPVGIRLHDFRSRVSRRTELHLSRSVVMSGRS
jgi:hypothetical protein